MRGGKTGRPEKPPELRRSIELRIRLTDSERTDYQNAADRAGVQLSEWVRDRLTKAAKRESKTD